MAIYAKDLDIQTGNITQPPGNVTSGLPACNFCLWYILYI